MSIQPLHQTGDPIDGTPPGLAVAGGGSAMPPGLPRPVEVRTEDTRGPFPLHHLLGADSRMTRAGELMPGTATGPHGPSGARPRGSSMGARLRARTTRDQLACGRRACGPATRATRGRRWCWAAGRGPATRVPEAALLLGPGQAVRGRSVPGLPVPWRSARPGLFRRVVRGQAGAGRVGSGGPGCRPVFGRAGAP